MYGRNDLRASLAPQPARPAPTRFKQASCVRFDAPPQESSERAKTWYARGQALVVAYSEAEAGAVFARADQPDEYAVVLPDEGTELEIGIPGQTEIVAGRAIAYIPAGDSTITVRKRGRLIRLVTARAADLAAKCANADTYATPDPNVAPFAPWPDPVGGPRIRVYRGDVPPEQGRFGRLYRGSTIMVNFGDGRVGRRAPDNLSPHHHDDFEQYSIALDGEFIHHLRWPWITDSTQWRPDEHVHCGAPSVTVIPPPVTHSSQGVTDGLNRLIDVFCPPRFDFSSRPGWVLNADDYPMPDPADR